MALTIFTQESAGQSTQASTESEKEATPGSIASYFRKEKRGASEIEGDNEEEVATKHRSSRIEFLNVKVNDVLAMSSELWMSLRRDRIF